MSEETQVNEETQEEQVGAVATEASASPSPEGDLDAEQTVAEVEHNSEDAVDQPSGDASSSEIEQPVSAQRTEDADGQSEEAGAVRAGEEAQTVEAQSDVADETEDADGAADPNVQPVEEQDLGGSQASDQAAPAEAVADASTEEPVAEATANTSTEEPVAEAVADASAEEPVAEAVADTSAEEPVAEAVADTSAEEPVAEAVADTSAEEPVAEAVADAPAEEPVAEAVADTPAEEPVAEAVADAPAEKPVAEAVADTDEPVAEAEDGQTAAPVAQTDAPSGQQESEAAPSGQQTEEPVQQDDDKKVVYLSVGQEVEGTVKRTTDFGAFVDIGAGRDGLIHISELSVGRVNKVTDVVKKGQQITCWIKKLDRKRNRISLTMISPDTKTLKDLEEGEIIEGTVSKIMPYGAFIDIGVGTDGLLHIREMSNGYVNKPEDVVKTGEKTEVRIIGIDKRRRRIDLSLKGLRDEPEVEQPETEFIAEAEGDETVEDPYADVEVLSPMELAFKKAMEAEGVEVDVEKAAKRERRRRKKGLAVQEEIIARTLETMKD